MSSPPAHSIVVLEEEEEPNTKSVLRSLLMALNETRDETFRTQCFEVMNVENAEDFVNEVRRRMELFLGDCDGESTADLDVSALIMSARATR